MPKYIHHGSAQTWGEAVQGPEEGCHQPFGEQGGEEAHNL